MAKNYGDELGWELGVDFPEWANTEIYVKTISKGYLLEGEKPKDAYWRVSTKVAQRLNKPQMASKFFDYIWKGWLCLATPVLSNTGTDRVQKSLQTSLCLQVSTRKEKCSGHGVSVL